jgi:hypothetical protein
VDPRAGLDDAEKRKFLTIPELELRPLGRPSRSKSLYGLRYPGFSSRSKLFPKCMASPSCLARGSGYSVKYFSVKLN